MDVLSSCAKGKRTLIETLDALADRFPEKVQASTLKTSEVKDGFNEITFRQVRDAADKFAWWLMQRYGRSEAFETITYIGLNDLRYLVVFYGAIKAGYKSLFISSRNTPDQNASLMSQTACKHLLYAKELESTAQAIQHSLKYTVQTAVIKSFDDWLADPVSRFPFDKPFELSKYDPVLVLHSSGSTGNPKPITHNNGFFATMDTNERQIPGRRLAGRATLDFEEGGSSFFCPFPPFHIAGFVALAHNTVFSDHDCSMIMGLPDRPPSSQLITDILRAKKPRSIYAPPSLVEGICQLDGGLEVLCQCDTVIYAGGPLSKTCGDLIAAKTCLSTVYGATEMGGVDLLLPASPNDWDYIEIHPDYHHRMEPAVDGAFELVFSQEDPDPLTRGVSWSLPHAREHRTKDLFLPHPTTPRLWKYYGRNDDIIVFSNGSKFNPIPAEDIFLSNPTITGAMIVGAGRTEVALLVEPRITPSSVDEFLDTLMQQVDQSNMNSQKQGYLSRSKIEWVEPGGFIRTPKGTVVRSRTQKKYEGVIDRLYMDLEAVANIRGPQFTGKLDVKDLLHFVRQSVLETRDVRNVDADADLFNNGFDSVQSARLTRLLKHGLEGRFGKLSWLTTQTVFEHPTILKLTRAIQANLAARHDAKVVVNGLQSDKDYIRQTIDAMIEKYQDEIIVNMEKTRPASKPSNRFCTVLLTGSTGSFGLRLLRTFINDSQTSRIYCLNRDPNAKQRTLDTLPGLCLDKAVFLTSDFGDDKLGLDHQQFRILKETVDIIIHNAWKVDFNHPLASFEHVHIRGVVNLSRLAAESCHAARLLFVSSISTMSNWHQVVDSSDEPIPSAVSHDCQSAAGMGYGQSKYVAERILEGAVTQSKGQLAATILRVGQIAGPTTPDDNGPQWNQSEWFPALVTTSKALGAVPEGLADVDWIPVDVLSDVVLEIAKHENTRRTDQISVFNLVNPTRTTWSSMVTDIVDHFGGSSRCQAVSISDWVKQLSGLDETDPVVLQRFPAVKILPFFRSLASAGMHRGSRFDTANGQMISKTLAALPPVHIVWEKRWLNEA